MTSFANELREIKNNIRIILKFFIIDIIKYYPYYYIGKA